MRHSPSPRPRRSIWSRTYGPRQLYTEAVEPGRHRRYVPVTVVAAPAESEAAPAERVEYRDRIEVVDLTPDLVPRELKRVEDLERKLEMWEDAADSAFPRGRRRRARRRKAKSEPSHSDSHGDEDEDEDEEGANDDGEVERRVRFLKRGSLRRGH
jgi:hypothetical protein